MTAQIADTKIDEVRERTDIVELVGRYVSLKRSGANHMGLCPFHSEKTPSFSVNAARQFCHCFGCGEGGDVFSFLMKIEGLSFPDAVRRLAEQAGVELQERELTPDEERHQQQRSRLYAINEAAADYFQQQLLEQPGGEPGRRYLRERGYGRKDAEEYRLGYALDSWDGLKNQLATAEFALEDIRTLGLIRPGKQGRGDYDLFRGRLIFPILDLTGKVVAFGGRVLGDGMPKYINSPESAIYHKGRVLFGLYQARQAIRQSGDVLLVEGYFDQLALQRAGFPQAVATCGTALTAAHARLLKRYAQRVVLLFDQDRAGRQATFKAMSALQDAGLPAAVIELPAGEDPDSFLHKFGGEVFAEKLKQAGSAMELFIGDCLAGAETVEAKVRAAEQVLRQIAGLSNELEQDLYLKKLAQQSGVERELLQDKLKRLLSAPARPDPADIPPLPDEAPPEQAPIAVEHYDTEVREAQISRTEADLLSLLLQRLVKPNAGDAAALVTLLQHPAARTIARALNAERGAAEDLAAVEQQLEPEPREMLQRLRAVAPERFGDDPERHFNDCVKKLQLQQIDRGCACLENEIRRLEKNGESDRKQLLAVQRYEIVRAKKNGNIKRAKDLLEEFKNLT